MIQRGDRLPSAGLEQQIDGKTLRFSLADWGANKRVILVGIPGAFTPVCTSSHIPGFSKQAAAFKAKGVERIGCISINDSFVMRAWGESLHVDPMIDFLADWSGAATRAMDLLWDGSEIGLGLRSNRYALVAKDGVVEQVWCEGTPATCTPSRAEAVLEALDQLA